jgi:hypothetical protein
VAAPTLRLIVRDATAPAEELGIAAALRRAAADRAAPPTLLISRLTGDAAALGRFQRAADPEGNETLRRHTGGAAVPYGEGRVSLCLVAPDLEAVADVPFLDKVVNRCVRGCVKGLAGLGLKALYGGRDYLTADRRPVALVGMAVGEGGTVLFQAVLGHTAPATPVRPAPKGPWATLVDLAPGLAFADLAEALASGYAAATGRALEAADAPAPAPLPFGPEDPAGLIWGPPVPVPIGTVSAGARLGPDGTLAELALAGELMVDDGAARALRDALAETAPDKTAPDAAAVGRAVHAVFKDPARHAVLGVPDPDDITRAVMGAISGPVAGARKKEGHVARV